MAYTFKLLRLLKSEIQQFESLKVLEANLYAATPAGKLNINREIDVLMEEIALASRMIRDYKASYSQGKQG